MHEIILLIVPSAAPLEGREVVDYETRLLRIADHHAVMPRAEYPDLFSFTVVVAAAEGDNALAKRAAAWCAEQAAKGVDIRFDTIPYVRDERRLLEFARDAFDGDWIEVVCDSAQAWKFRFHARRLFRASTTFGVVRDANVPILRDDVRQAAEIAREVAMETLPKLYRRLPPRAKEFIRRRSDDPRSWVNA